MKRLLSILLCVTLAAVLVPTAALAEDGAGPDAPAAETGEPISPAEPAPSPLPEESDSAGGQDTPDPAPVSPAVTGVTVTANGITEEAGASPSQLDGYYTYSEDLHTLTVLQDGVTLSGSSEDLAVKTADGLNSVTLQKLSLGADLPFQSGSGSLTVTVADTVSLTGSGSSAIRCGGALTIQGGILKAAGERQGIDAQGYPLTLTGVDLEVSGSDCGLRAAGGALTIDSARVIAQGQQDGICVSSPAVRSAGARSGQETYMDNAPLVLTTNSSVTAEGALAGIATDCDVIIRDSAAFSSGGDWGGIRLCDSLSTGAIGSGGASLTLAGATEITGGPDSDLAASGQLLIDLTRGGSVQAAGVRSGTAITCGDKTCIVTPENGFIGPCTDGGNGQTCYTVFAPAQGDTPSTVAEEVAFACTEDGPTYTVTFDSNGGSPVESQTVLSGSCAQPPEEPTWDGSFFLYWADETGAEYSFATPVTADLTLTAVWTGGPEDTYTITFDTRGGSRVDSQTVPIGSRARKPKDPVKSGCTFQYWECEDGNEYDFDTPVASDVALMAVWAPRAAGGAHSSDPNSSHSSSTASSRRSGKSAASPETGDGFHPALLAGALALSGGGIAALAILRRKSAD